MARKWFKIGSGVAVSITSLIGLFFLLQSVFSFEITGHDTVCLGIPEDPCLSTVLIKNPTKYDVDILNPNDIKLDFVPQIKQYYLFEKDARCKGGKGCAAPNGVSLPGWNYIDLTQDKTGKKYVYRFPKKSTTEWLIWGLKHNVDDNIKWTLGIDKNTFQNGELDPSWLPSGEDINLGTIVPDGLQDDKESGNLKYKFKKKQEYTYYVENKTTCYLKPDHLDDGMKDCINYAKHIYSGNSPTPVYLNSSNITTSFLSPVKNLKIKFSNTSSRVNKSYTVKEVIVNETDKFYKETTYNYLEDEYTDYIDLPAQINIAQNSSLEISYSDEKYVSNSFNVTLPKVGHVDPTQSECGEVNTSGVYTQNQSLNTTGSCLTINAVNSTYDCNGFNISGDFLGSGDIGITLTGNGTTIQECLIYQFEHGINFADTAHNNRIINNTIANQTDYGIIIDRGVENGTIENNTFQGQNFGVLTDTDAAIILDNGDNFNITNNTFLGNYSLTALRVADSTNDDNRIWKNKFYAVNGTLNAGTNTSYCHESGIGNFYNTTVPIHEIPQSDCGPAPNGYIFVNSSADDNVQWGSNATVPTIQGGFHNANKTIVIIDRTNNYTQTAVTVRNAVSLQCHGGTLQGTGAETGIHILGEKKIVISNCTFNNYSIAVKINASGNNTLNKSKFIRNAEAGILLVNTINNSVFRNNISFNQKRGLVLDGNTSLFTFLNRITENYFQNNTLYAINITDSRSENNSIYKNNFMENNGNTNQSVSFGSENSWNVSGHGNYWTDFDSSGEGCEDDNVDELCDTSYNLTGSGLNKDFFPYKAEIQFALCDCPASGNWVIDMSLACTLSAPCNLSDYNVTFTKKGLFTIESDLNVSNLANFSNKTKVFIKNSAKVNLK